MQFLVLCDRDDCWYDTDATAARIVAAYQARGEPAAVIWAEAYAELACVARFRFSADFRRDAAGLARSADVVAGGLRFAAQRQGLDLPDDWLLAGGGNDQLRRQIWGRLATVREAELDANAAAFEHLSAMEQVELLERLSAELRVQARRAAFQVVDGGLK